MASEIPARVIAGISFVGSSDGLVRSFRGFKKGHHRPPDAANATTNSFLGKICAEELTEKAEQTFQQIRVGLGYKRRDLTVAMAGPAAVLTAKDFTFEISYALQERDPSRYTLTQTLRDLGSAKLAGTSAFDAIFSGVFTEISFALSQEVQVSAVIDAIESLDGSAGLAVTYPSDCRECVIRVEHVAAQVRCGATMLNLVFPHAGSPRELVEAFATVRSAFSISRELAELVG